MLSARPYDVSSGTVRICWTREDKPGEGGCNKGNGTAQVTVTDNGPSIWTAAIKGRDQSTSPTASISVDFNAFSPSVTLKSFRWVGTIDPSRNGFAVEVDGLSDGNIQVQGGFEGSTYSYHLVIQPTDGAPIHDELGGPSDTFVASESVSGQNSYRVTLSSPEDMTSNSGTAFVQAAISWP